MERFRIACFSDTFGPGDNNGVGRFLDDLLKLSLARDLPFRIVAPGKQGARPGLQFVRAPAFSIPGYPDLSVSMPLEHQRKSLLHELRAWCPDVIHVSTPGPFGCLGVAIAQQLRVPLVGVYHTDFPRYAFELVRNHVARLQSRPEALLEFATGLPTNGLGNKLYAGLEQLGKWNDDLESDIAQLMEIVSRNGTFIADNVDVPVQVASLAQNMARYVLQKFYQRFSLVITRSKAQRQQLHQDLGISKKRIKCLTPGTDIERFHPKRRDEAWRPTLGIPKDAFVVLYVGRVTPEKNIRFLAEVWQCLLEMVSTTDRELHLVVVGSGDKESLDSTRQLPRTHLLGPRPTSELQVLYASADVLLFPSNTETLGQVGLEAGASGLPVFVSDQGGPREYVRHGVTGWVLPTEVPETWAATILHLARNEPLRVQVARQARQHVAASHPLERSLSSYWKLHQFAVQQTKKKLHAKATRRAAAEQRPTPTPRSPLPGIMVISDYHAGKRFGSPSQRVLKEHAVTTMLNHAKECQLRVIFGGDFGDHGSQPERLQADFAMLRRVLEYVALPRSPLLIRGNHDYGFTDQQLMELMGGCEIHRSLAYFDPASKVFVTHGHILSLQQLTTKIRAAADSRSIEDALREEVLSEELRPSVIAYDLANLVESQTQALGLMGLGKFWDGLFEHRGRLAKSLLTWSQHTGDRDERTWKLIASLIGAHDDAQMAALLGYACGGWAAAFGHTHKPQVLRPKPFRVDPALDGLAPPTPLVGNSGNVNRKRPSCLIARFPELRLLRFDAKSGELNTTRRQTLDEAEVRQYEAFSECIRETKEPNVPLLPCN